MYIGYMDIAAAETRGEVSSFMGGQGRVLMLTKQAPHLTDYNVRGEANSPGANCQIYPQKLLCKVGSRSWRCAMRENAERKCACGAVASVAHPIAGPQCLACASLRKQLEDLVDAAEADEQQQFENRRAAAMQKELHADSEESRETDVSQR